MALIIFVGLEQTQINILFRLISKLVALITYSNDLALKYSSPDRKDTVLEFNMVFEFLRADLHRVLVTSEEKRPLWALLSSQFPLL